MPEETQYRMVVVEWLDACGQSGWMEPDEIKRGTLTITAGFLIDDGDDGIAMCQDVSENGTVNGSSFIPRGMVRTVTFLEPRLLPAEAPHV